MFRSQYLILSVVLMVCCNWAYGGQQVNKTIDADLTGTLYIDNTRGQLIIEGWDKPQIQLSGELDDATRKLLFKSKGHKAIIKVLLKDGVHRGHGSELKVFVPRNTYLRFKGVNTDFSFSRLGAKLQGKTINGDLTLEDIHGVINVATVSGKVSVVDSSGVAQIESVAGHLAFGGSFEQAQLKSMSGNIMANIDKLKQLKVENVSGDIAISGKLQNSAKVWLNSVSGDIRYFAGGKFNGECQVASQFGGKIDNQLTADKPWNEMLSQRKLKIASGDGSGKLIMNTVSGSVFLEK